MYSPRTINIINVRITHKTARAPLIEAVGFRDKAHALLELSSWGSIDECAILQTCNRVELYLVSEEGEPLARR
ncbi:MAG: hypothetical protein QFX35_06360, partial [Candidatus Verstraetearchaeota archaeon]|nr:hypothetical protein [Candidatus Verstraetearchaeota archaeon]